MRKWLPILLGSALSGCANSPSKDFYLACVDSGLTEPVCRMRAAEMRQVEPNRLRQVGRALSAAGEGMRRAEAQVPRAPTQTRCHSRDTGFGQTTVNCTTYP